MSHLRYCIGNPGLPTTKVHIYYIYDRNRILRGVLKEIIPENSIVFEDSEEEHKQEQSVIVRKDDTIEHQPH